MQGIAESKKVAAGAAAAHEVVKRFYDSKTTHLDEQIVECRVAFTHDETMVETSWWIKHLQQLDEAIQDVLVFLGADVRHGAAPMYGEEREVLDALADVTGAASSTD